MLLLNLNSYLTTLSNCTVKYLSKNTSTQDLFPKYIIAIYYGTALYSIRKSVLALKPDIFDKITFNNIQIFSQFKIKHRSYLNIQRKTH